MKKKSISKKVKKAKDDWTGIFIPAGLFIGMGVGFMIGNFLGGLLLGLGLGFFCMALAKGLKK